MTYSHEIKNFLETHVGPQWRPVLAIIALSGLGAAGWHFYTNYKLTQQQEAQLNLADVLQDRQKAILGMTNWDQAALSADLGYRLHQSSWAGPYFLLADADGQAHEGKLNEAITTLDSALKNMPSKNPLYSFFLLKQALFKVQSPEQSVQQEGIAMLETIAKDSAALNRDAALYYLGYLAFSNNDNKKAKDYWLQVQQEFPQTDEGASGWAQLATEQLKSLA